MKHFVAIAGNIGVGKSTLTGLLSRRFGWEPFPEPVDANPTWPILRRHAALELSVAGLFLSRRLRHHRLLLDRPHSVIQDRSVYEDAEIFARNLYLKGTWTSATIAAMASCTRS